MKNIINSYIYKSLYVVGLFVIIGVILKLFIFSKTTDNDKDYQEVINRNYSVYALPLPKTLDFAGEKVPMEYFDVRENLDKELLRVANWHSQTLGFIKKARRYFFVIEPILKANNIPDDFKYLAIAESGLANVISPSNAVGVWQFLKDTGIEFGLEINDEVDERYHLAKSTEAACKYFNKMYTRYKSWALVAAAYNTGLGNLNKQLESQNVNSYYDLLLNEETGRYVYNILAIKLIMKTPQNYGFRFRLKDLYPVVPTTDIQVDSSITNLVAFAEKYTVNYKLLKYFNPWLRGKKLTNKEKKAYLIAVPREGFRTYDYSKDITEPDTLINFKQDSVKRTK